MIKIQNLTKDYGHGKGIFDINITIRKGEVIGMVGTNGAGKTTIIRNIMGFLKPDEGKITINGYDSYLDADITKKFIGYIPGEIAFPDFKDGIEFLNFQRKLSNLKDQNYAFYLIEKLQLDPSANLKRMSKGMKQKTASVAALMNDAEILILDEPTTGLDPLMRMTFLDIIKEEKKKDKTILISSHLYDELERICDRVILIDKGKIVNMVDLKKIKNSQTVDLKIEFMKKQDFLNFQKLSYQIIRVQEEYQQITIRVNKNKLQSLFQNLIKYDIKFISEVKFSLEKYFLEIIRKENYDD